MKRSFSIGLVALFFLTAGAHGNSQELRTEHDGEGYRVQVVLNGRNVLTSPPEGLWSIATDWKDGWPTSWFHARPSDVEHVGDWTILRGKLQTSQGTWQLSDSYRPEGKVIKCIRRFRWEGKETAERVTLSVRFQCLGKGSKVVLPGILYHGNPSGARSGRVPVYSGKPGAKKPSTRSTAFPCRMPAWNGPVAAVFREQRCIRCHHPSRAAISKINGGHWG